MTSKQEKIKLDSIIDICGLKLCSNTSVAEVSYFCNFIFKMKMTSSPVVTILITKQ